MDVRRANDALFVDDLEGEILDAEDGEVRVHFNDGTSWPVHGPVQVGVDYLAFRGQNQTQFLVPFSSIKGVSYEDRREQTPAEGAREEAAAATPAYADS